MLDVETIEAIEGGLDQLLKSIAVDQPLDQVQVEAVPDTSVMPAQAGVTLLRAILRVIGLPINNIGPWSFD